MASENTRGSASTGDLRNTDKVSGAANSIYATLAGEGPGEGPGEKHELGKGPEKSETPVPQTQSSSNNDAPKLQVETKQ